MTLQPEFFLYQLGALQGQAVQKHRADQLRGREARRPLCGRQLLTVFDSLLPFSVLSWLRQLGHTG
jgi:hypothetical protein